MKKIRIAIAGHTNTGKTTLIRCLTKRDIGRVEDRANVTVTNEAVYHNSLQAEFIDTPGLQEAGKALLIRKLISNDEQFEKMLLEENLGLELKITKALKSADVAYYVISVANVPDSSYTSELNFIKSYCRRVIGIINASNVISDDKEKLLGHLNQWNDFFQKENVDSIVYDFHWDSAKKEIELYSKTYSMLDEINQAKFSEGVRLLNAENSERRKKILHEINRTLDECTKLSRSTIIGISGHETTEETKDKLVKDVIGIVNQYARNVGSIYSVNVGDYFSQKVSLSAKTVQEIILVSKSTKKIEETLGNVTGGVGVGATVGAVSGGITLAQAAIAGVALTGGLFLAPLAIFAGIGAVVGAVSGATSSHNDTKEIMYSLQNTDLFSVTKVLIAVVWTIAYFGYEKNKSSPNRTERIEYLVDNEIPSLFEEFAINADNFREKSIEVLERLGV